jgi:hypothetical protein
MPARLATSRSPSAPTTCTSSSAGALSESDESSPRAASGPRRSAARARAPCGRSRRPGSSLEESRRDVWAAGVERSTARVDHRQRGVAGPSTAKAAAAANRSAAGRAVGGGSARGGAPGRASGPAGAPSSSVDGDGDDEADRRAEDDRRHLTLANHDQPGVAAHEQLLPAVLARAPALRGACGGSTRSRALGGAGRRAHSGGLSLPALPRAIAAVL